MTIETATYINDLQPVNPASTDAVSQGDDHLRLIKQVLQNQFGNAARQWQIPSTVGVSASVTLTKADGEIAHLVITTGGAINITLPSGLTGADNGWSCTFMKVSGDANPFFLVPPAGANLVSVPYSVAKARRCIPGVLTRAVWNGAGSFYCNRVTELPIGTLLDYWGATLPSGYEWPNGQTLTPANYPEYAAGFNSTGGTPDVRGSVCVPLDNLGGGAAGRLPSTYINPYVVGSYGGADHSALTQGNIPNLPVSVSGSISGSGTFYPAGNSGYNFPIGAFGWSYQTITGPGSAYGPVAGSPGTFTNNVSGSVSGSCSASGTATGSGGSLGAAFPILPPSVMVGKILVVE